MQVNGSEGRGVAGISPMLTITRLHNSVSAIGAMRRLVHLVLTLHLHNYAPPIYSILQLARDYSTKRTAFHKYIVDHPLHMQTLARMEVKTKSTSNKLYVHTHPQLID